MDDSKNELAQAGQHLTQVLNEVIALRRKIYLTDVEQSILFAKGLELNSAINKVIALGGDPNDYA